MYEMMSGQEQYSPTVLSFIDQTASPSCRCTRLIFAIKIGYNKNWPFEFSFFLQLVRAKLLVRREKKKGFVWGSAD